MNSFINIIIGILLSLIDLYLIHLYLGIDKSTFNDLKNVKYYVVEFILLLIINLDVTRQYIINFILYFFILCIISIFFIKDKKERLKFVSFLLVLKICIYFIVKIVFSWLFQTVITFGTESRWLSSYGILSNLIERYIELFTITFLIKENSKYKVNFHHFKIITIIISIYFSINIILLQPKLFYFPSVGRTFTFIIVLYNLALIGFDRYQTKHEAIEYKLRVVNQNIDIRRDHMDEFLEAKDDMRAIRHNIKNNMTMIGGFISDNKPEEALKLIDKIVGDIDRTSACIHTGDTSMDSIINKEVSIMKEHHIEFKEKYGIITIGSITETDLALILGLALDNAIEAVDKIKDGEKTISLNIHTNSNYLIVTITNSIVPGSHIKFDRTSKIIDSENHGYGVREIKRLCHDYQGEATYEVKHDKVVLKILLNFKTKEKA